MAMLNNQRVPAINMASLWSDGSDLRLSECNRVVPGSRPRCWRRAAGGSCCENHLRNVRFADGKTMENLRISQFYHTGGRNFQLIIGDFSIVWVPCGAQQLAIGKFCEPFGSCCDTAGFCTLSPTGEIGYRKTICLMICSCSDVMKCYECRIVTPCCWCLILEILRHDLCWPHFFTPNQGGKIANIPKIPEFRSHPSSIPKNWWVNLTPKSPWNSPPRPSKYPVFQVFYTFLGLGDGPTS